MQQNIKKFLSEIDRFFVKSGESSILVHSSFRNLSHRGVRAEDFIEQILQAMPNSTLLMPTMSWRTVTPENPVFDALLTKSHTGVLSEVFRQKFASHRSLHPTHSVAGFGKKAEYLLSSHHLRSTPVSEVSPYGLMRSINSFILLLGCGYDVCTAIHYPEEIIAPKIYLEESLQNYQIIDKNKKIFSYKLRPHKKIKRIYDQINLKKAVIAQGNVLGTNWVLLDHERLVEFIIQKLNKNPYFLVKKNSE